MASTCQAHLDTMGTYTLPLTSMSYRINELLLEDGGSPFAKWFGSLEAVAAAKVRVAVSRMEQGNLSNVEWFRGIGEYKIDWGPGLRIYLAKDGLKIIILSAAVPRSVSSRTSTKRWRCGKTTSAARHQPDKESKHGTDP